MTTAFKRGELSGASASAALKSATKPAIVIDTNIIVSAIVFPASGAMAVLIKALNRYSVVVSGSTWDELASVLQRPKFDSRLPLAKRLLALTELARNVREVKVTSVITDCRDPKDNKFLALAIDGAATVIVTGDNDLLVLNPYRSIVVCKASDFLTAQF